MREDVNFLISQGHHNANRYPVGRVWSEVEITRRRVNNEMASQASVDHTVHGAIHGGKKGHSVLTKMIKRLTNGGA